jgi:hypothetical protein
VYAIGFVTFDEGALKKYLDRSKDTIITQGLCDVVAQYCSAAGSGTGQLPALQPCKSEISAEDAN